ncbi:MAG: DNA-3-methyladenine glycosylase [Chloroflexota bacterium]|nr:DNA-3-methyladenine glycosylase [Chloroflexota bacterium]
MPSAELALPAPLDVRTSLEVFRRWGDDLVDRWDGEVLLRTLRTGGGPVAWAATPTGDPGSPRLRVSVDDPAHLDAAVAAGHALFVTAPEAFESLRAGDAAVAAAEARHPGVRGVREPDLLTALVRSISAQQVNLRWAATTRARLVRATGVVRSAGGREVWALDPQRLAETDPAELRALQFTTRKAEYIVGVAAEVSAGRLDLEQLRARGDEEVVERLVAVRGLGRWTAEWVLARTLGRPRVVAGDLGVRKAVGAAYLGGRMPTEAEVRALTVHWGAGAAVAQAVLLHSLVSGSPLR